MFAALVVLFGFLSPIHQNPAYHDFASTSVDSTGIPNTYNVISNIPFALVGLYGLKYCLAHPQLSAPKAWPVFFSGVALTSIGSALYHWNPNDAMLVFDRIPMTIAFMALLVAIFSEQVDAHLEDYLLLPMLIVGISSVVYWRLSDDLRLYALVQFFPLLAIPLIFLASPARSDSGKYLAIAFICYVAAKACEIYDREIWALIGLSGHAIKHLFAACSALSLLWMLKKRQRL